MSPAREQVMAELVAVAKAAADRGEDGYTAVMNAFPGIPVQVATEAWCAAEDEKVAEWWQGVERTIDAQVIRKAIISAS